jgi:hypothetical protein
MSHAMRRAMIGFVLAAGIAGLAPLASAEPPPPPPPTMEVATRPSGFWTNPRPAIGGAYRYRLLGVGCVVALGMGLLIRRVIRNANRERAIRDAAAEKLAPKVG